jgi:hypothetical protein
MQGYEQVQRYNNYSFRYSAWNGDGRRWLGKHNLPQMQGEQDVTPHFPLLGW